MIDAEVSKRLNDGIEEVIMDVLGEEHKFIFILPISGAMLSNVDDPYQCCTTLTGAAYSLLSGNFDRRVQKRETGEEVKSN